MVSANGACSELRCYKKSNESQDARRWFPNILNEPLQPLQQKLSGNWNMLKAKIEPVARKIVSGGPQKGHFWPYLAIFCHRLSWLPQMGWTLVEQGWTLYLTSEGGRWTPLDPTKIVPEGPRGPLKPPNDHFRGYLAIFGPIWVFGWLCQIRSSGVSLKRSSKM